MNSSEVKEFVKENFDEMMKKISPFIPNDVGTEVTTIGKWECGKNNKEESLMYPHFYSA